jgi:hypothetical protein
MLLLLLLKQQLLRQLRLWVWLKMLLLLLLLLLLFLFSLLLLLLLLLLSSAQFINVELTQGMQLLDLLKHLQTACVEVARNLDGVAGEILRHPRD